MEPCNNTLLYIVKYPDQIDYIMAVIEADTVRKAQNQAKKIFPRIRFNGRFAPQLLDVNDKYAHLYTKKADKRLHPDRADRHNEALKSL